MLGFQELLLSFSAVYATASTNTEIWSYVRSRALTPQALRFLCIKIQKEFLGTFLIQGMFTIAPSSFPGKCDFLPRCDVSQALVLGFLPPSSRASH